MCAQWRVQHGKSIACVFVVFPICRLLHATLRKDKVTEAHGTAGDSVGAGP